MSKENFKVIEKPSITEYPSGTFEYDHECDVCHKPNYPIITWDTDDDPYIKAFICSGCMVDILNGVAKRLM